MIQAQGLAEYAAILSGVSGGVLSGISNVANFEPTLGFLLPLRGGLAIEEPLPFQPLPVRSLVPVLGLSRLAEAGFMPQAGEFLPLLTVGFMPTRLALIGDLGLGSHRLLISVLAGIANFLLKCVT